MIRHITTKATFEKIIKDGFIYPSKENLGSSAPEKEYVAFETYNGNKVFYKAFYNTNRCNSYRYPNLSEEDLIGLILDENKLKNEHYEIIFSPVGTETYLDNGKKFTTKFENSICPFITKEEYIEIGEYVFIRGRIPIRFIEEIEKWK